MNHDQSDPRSSTASNALGGGACREHEVHAQDMKESASVESVKKASLVSNHDLSRSGSDCLVVSPQEDEEQPELAQVGEEDFDHALIMDMTSLVSVKFCGGDGPAAPSMANLV